LKTTKKRNEQVELPHKGTPIRYRQNQPVRNRQQGATQRATRHTIKVDEAASEFAMPQIECAVGYWRFS